MKFLHAADIHLDSPLRGLERYEGAPVDELRGATRKALANLVDLAREEKVDFILVAGDLYDGDWRDYNTGLFFARQMGRLREAGIKVFLIRGNHDAASQISRELKLPENVVEFSTRKSETVEIADLGVAIHGQGFSTASVTTDLSEAYPTAHKGVINIGLLHTCATGRDGHENYAPCTLAGLRSKEYDYWALGHIHQREELCQDPWIVFPGNIQGRHARETGSKGVTLVVADQDGIVRVEHRPVDVGRWRQCVVSAQGAHDANEVLDRCRRTLLQEVELADDRWLAVRFQIQGPCRVHEQLAGKTEQFVNDCRVLANELGEGRVWVEKVNLATTSEIGWDDALERADAIGDLVRYVRALPTDQDAMRQLLEEFKELKQKLPAEVREGVDGIDLESPTMLQSLLPAVEQILLPRLLAPEAAR